MTVSFLLLVVLGMGEEEANRPKVLLVRLQWPVNELMVVQVMPHRDFLVRCWKLMLICQKIRLTMGGAGQVVIESHGQLYITIRSETAIQRLVSKARVRDWESFKCLWVPTDFYIGECCVMAGIRRTTTNIEEGGIWFEGTDGSSQMVSVRLTKTWLRAELEERSNSQTLK